MKHRLLCAALVTLALLNCTSTPDSDQYANLTPEEICDKLGKTEKSDILILDVRTQEEYDSKEGRLENATLIPIGELESRLGEIEQYKDKEVVVYCAAGVRGARGGTILANNGFTKISNMQGGMNEWNKKSSEELPCKD